MKSFSSRYKIDLCCRVLFLTFFAQVFTLNVMGDAEVIVDGIKYNIVSETRTASVIANNYSGNVVIPSSFTSDGVEYSVTRIYEEAFQDCTNLTSITIPKNITSIGHGAFSGCYNLTSVNITDLAAWCNISIADNSPLYYAHHLYLNGQEIEDLVIPNNVIRIGECAFQQCSSLKSVTIPNSVTSIGEEAFYGCTGLEKVNITDLAAWCNISIADNSPLYYAHHLYLNGQEIEDLVIPNNVIRIGECAFQQCSSLKSVTIPNSVTSIGNLAFSGCSSLTSVTIPNGVTTIEDGVFSGCSSLTSINIPNGVTSIGYGAFQECTGLEYVIIPKSVSSIGQDAFFLCSNIRLVYCFATQVPNTSSSSFGDYVESATLCVPDSSIDKYRSVSPWNNFGVISITLFDFEKDGINYKINSDGTSVTVEHSNYYSGTVEIPSNVIFDDIKYNVTAIGKYAFWHCNGLTSVTIGSGSIGDYAFEDCSSLTSITIGSGVTSIGTGAFNYCKSLEAVNITDLASWCKISFSNSSPLAYAHHLYLNGQEIKDMVIPNSVTNLDHYVFAFCTGLTSVIIPNTVTSIGYGSFFGCTGLTSITIPNSVISIGDSAFDGCTGLTSITIPNSVTTIDNWAFSRCTGLTSVTIPNSVTSIGRYAFDNCTGLKSITIPNSVTSIGKEAFYNCSGLTKAEFASIESLCKIEFGSSGANPLGHAKHLYINGQEVTKLVIPQGVTGIGNYAFSGCSGLTSITIPKSVTNIGDGAFGGCTGLNTIYSDATIPPSLSSNSFDYDGSTPALYVLSGCKDSYANAQYWNRFNIIEHAYVESIEINVPQYDIIVGESKSIDVIILPSTATVQDLYWKIDNPDIATIDNGVVTGIKTGTTVITATTTDGTNLSASCTVNVTNPVIALTLDRISAELMVGQQITLQATCTPSNADNINVSWSSNNEDIASVNNGVVIAKGLGDAIITASSVNGIEATCKITVVPTPVTSLSLNTTSVDLVKDATYQLTCSITPEDATNKGLVWTSLNSGVASVNESGLVTAMSTGTTTIIVSSASNSEITASCIINVTTPVTSIKLDHGVLEMFVEDAIQLKATCMPSDADNANVVWSTTNGEIAIVSQAGYITAKNEGDVTIAATTTDGTNLSASCWIHVKRHKQAITWSQESLTCQEGGEMIVLEANSNRGLPVSFSSSAPEIVSIFDLGDIVYANPIKEGKTIITAYQQGNYKYEPTEMQKEIEVIGKSVEGYRTLVAYYSQSKLIDGIVTELTNQIADANIQVYTQKIESSNARIDEANHNADVRDSIMNVIALYPDYAESYPDIKPLSASVNDYDAVILVYPIWNDAMAAPMQTFCFHNKDILRTKSVAFVEYDLFDVSGLSSDAKVLRLSPSNIEDKSDLIRDWLNSEATGILQLMHGDNFCQKEIYDLQGRKLSGVPLHGIFFIDGRKIAK